LLGKKCGLSSLSGVVLVDCLSAAASDDFDGCLGGLLEGLFAAEALSTKLSGDALYAGGGQEGEDGGDLDGASTVFEGVEVAPGSAGAGSFSSSRHSRGMVAGCREIW
jgi:hypothetical protein